MAYILEKFESLHAKYPSTMGRSYALLAAFSQASVTIFMKATSKNVHIVSILPVQATIATCVCFMIFGAVGDSMYNPDPSLTGALMFRAILGSANFSLFNYGMRVLPIQKFIVLCNTMPIWVVVISPFLLNEYPNRILLAMLAVSCIGIVIMVDPGLVLPESMLPAGTIDSQEKDYSSFLLLIPVLGALMGACISIFLKKFAGRITTGQNACFFLSFTCFFSGLSATITNVPQNERISNISDIVLVGLGGCSVLGFQTFLSLAVKYEKRASYVSLLINSQIIMAYTMDVIILGNSIKLLNVVGGAMIICASTAIALSKEEKSAEVKQATDDKIAYSPAPQHK